VGGVIPVRSFQRVANVPLWRECQSVDEIISPPNYFYSSHSTIALERGLLLQNLAETDVTSSVVGAGNLAMRCYTP
jgi:hypothetical protein